MRISGILGVFSCPMNRPRYLLDSIIAQKDSASEFSHSLDPKATLALPQKVEHWSMTMLREKLIKIGARSCDMAAMSHSSS